MKRVKWNLDTPYRQYYGEFEVDDDATNREIDEEVRDTIWSIGMIMYDWDVEEIEETK